MGVLRRHNIKVFLYYIQCILSIIPSETRYFNHKDLFTGIFLEMLMPFSLKNPSAYDVVFYKKNQTAVVTD